MRKRDRQPVDAADQASAKPPAPEAQGDGEPAPRDLQQDLESSDGAPAAQRASQAAEADSTSDLGRELDEQRDRYLRLAAEYDNYRKRTLKERAEASARGQAELVTRLLEAIDDLARFAHIDPATTDSQTLHKGIEMVEQKVLKTLTAAGLEIINPLDLTFDPTEHEAVTTEPAIAPEDDDTVARVFQPGYRFNGQLLRPARVVVKQWRG